MNNLYGYNFLECNNGHKKDDDEDDVYGDREDGKSGGDEDDDKNDAIKVFFWLEEVVVEFSNMNSCEIEILAICLQAPTIPSSASPFNAFESYQQFCATLSSNIYAIKLNIKVEI